jgi:hypothetical protein
MTNKQIIMPSKILTIYNFYESLKEQNKNNSFKLYKQIRGQQVYCAENISNLNFYYIDFIINKKVNPKFIMTYFKNTHYRNHFSNNLIKSIVINKINNNEWDEEEIYNKSKNIFRCVELPFHLIFYNNKKNPEQNTSERKYYNSYQLLTTPESYILRFQIVLSYMDLDQDVDLSSYILQIQNLIKAIHNKFNTDKELDYETDSDDVKSE